MIEIVATIATVNGELIVHVTGRGTSASAQEDLYYAAIRTSLTLTIAEVRQGLVERGMASPGSIATGNGAVAEHSCAVLAAEVERLEKELVLRTAERDGARKSRNYYMELAGAPGVRTKGEEGSN